MTMIRQGRWGKGWKDACSQLGDGCCVAQLKWLCHERSDEARERRQGKPKDEGDCKPST
jgi:hypothetical protein